MVHFYCKQSFKEHLKIKQQSDRRVHNYYKTQQHSPITYNVINKSFTWKLHVKTKSFTCQTLSNLERFGQTYRQVYVHPPVPGSLVYNNIFEGENRGTCEKLRILIRIL